MPDSPPPPATAPHDVMQPDVMQPVEDALSRLEQEMPGLQHRHRDLFAYANAWAERHDAVLALAPPGARAEVEARLRRIGIRWGLVGGTRMTTQFPALRTPR